MLLFSPATGLLLLRCSLVSMVFVGGAGSEGFQGSLAVQELHETFGGWTGLYGLSLYLIVL